MKTCGVNFKNCGFGFSPDDMHDFERAVGWESEGEPFATGDVPAEVVSRIKQFGDRRWECEKALRWSRTLSDPNRIIAVPMDGVLYIAPGDIDQMIKLRRYLPPQEFLDAVMKAPLPDTLEYEAAVSSFRESYREERGRMERTLHEHHIEVVADWVIRHGGDESAIEAWVRMFEHNLRPSQKRTNLDQVRKKMQSLKDTGPGA
jgi:hypothetical protein